MGRLSRRARQGLRTTAGLGVSAAAIYLLLREIDLRLVGAALAQAQWLLLVAAAGMYFVALTIRAWRWTVLLTPVKQLSLAQVWPISVLGYAGNLILPARLGEVLRAAVLRTRDVPMSAGLATIATERAIDVLTAVGLVLLTMPLLPEGAPQWLITAGRVVGMVFAAGLLVLWLVVAARSLVARILERLTTHFPLFVKPAAWVLRFVDGLAVLHSPALLVRTLGITVLAWLATVAEYWLAMAALGVHLTPAAAAFCISALGLGSAVPAAPGYIGTQELVGVTVLGLWGVPAAAALAASLAFHMIEIVPIGVVGLIVAWREGVNLSPAVASSIGAEKTA